LAEAFTPTPDEVGWARGRTQSEQYLLALAVLLKCYQRLGYFPKLTEVPLVVVDHVRTVLGLAEGVGAGHDSDRTLFRHREFVRDRLGVVYEPARACGVAEAAIRKAVQTKDNPADLINVALEELVRARCELPGYSTSGLVSAVRGSHGSGCGPSRRTRFQLLSGATRDCGNHCRLRTGDTRHTPSPAVRPESVSRGSIPPSPRRARLERGFNASADSHVVGVRRRDKYPTGGEE
jgi:Domain of unknown function (DUF4158)